MLKKYDDILHRLENIETAITTLHERTLNIDIINRKELQKRLGKTEATIIRWEKRGRIKGFRIGNAVLYNWPSVVSHLEQFS